MFSDKPSHLKDRKTCSKKCLGEYFKTALLGSKNPHWKGGSIILKCKECKKDYSVFPCNKLKSSFCSYKCHGVNWGRKITGKPPWNKGIFHSEETKKKMSKAKRRQVRKIRLCSICKMPGLKHKRITHEECRKKRTLSAKRHICFFCKKEFFKYCHNSSKKIFCNKECRNKSRSGEGNSNWQGGIMSENKKIRQSPEYKLWREAVFKRDEWTCVWCGQRGGKLNADHIKSFALFPELRLTVSNGRTLCFECHKKTDTYLKNTKKRYPH